MHKKRVLMYGMLGLMVFFLTCVILAHALAYTEKREVLLTASFTIDGEEQKFKAFYLSAPAEGFEIEFNVSKGSIKFSPWQASVFEDSHGYFDYYINETTVEKRQVWFFNGSEGGVGCSVGDVNQVWYILFFNEDSYEKEVYLRVTKFWKEQNYRIWTAG